jgi:CheY-like chemotaxis protein
MSRRYGGTGLGLVISIRLAQAMGGTIQLQSTVNVGSTFRLVLPCEIPDLPPDARPAPAAPFVAPQLCGRVLVVEDDSVNRQVIDLLLKKLGLTASFAPDGESALTLAAARAFDLVLMDCQLPGIDGLETTRRLRAAPAGRSLKIVALTANASTHVRSACFAAGMDDFLSKPIRFELLATTLSKWLAPSTITAPPA